MYQNFCQVNNLAANDMRAKGLATPKMESNGVAMALDNVEDLDDLEKAWQGKGLEAGGQELGEGALTGGTGRGDHPNRHVAIIALSLSKSRSK